MQILSASIRTESGRTIEVREDSGVYRFVVSGPMAPGLVLDLLTATTAVIERSGDAPKGKPPTEELWRLLDMRVDELCISVRPANCLQNAHIIYIGEIVSSSEKELLKIKGMGKGSIADIRRGLKEVHPYLDIPSYDRKYPRVVFTDGWLRPNKRQR